MRALPSLVVCLLAALPSPARGSGGQGADADEAAIRALVGRYVDARERRDAEAIAELFTSDADQLTSAGEWRRGRDEVVRGALASSRATGGRRAITVEAVRFPAPGVAVADGRYEISGLEGGGTRRMWTTFVLTLGPDGWRIAAIRNMMPAPPARSGGR
ncbi:MAG TPA: SgcJ/EcaC family oxidoreductase [Vicinamibacteria bacterium]|nr:SgcJ/EcaC family oxidoreductase [Vicinamibacteria bacterium]